MRILQSHNNNIIHSEDWRGWGELTATEDNISDVIAFTTEIVLTLGRLFETASKTIFRTAAVQLISCDKSLCINTVIKMACEYYNIYECPEDNNY